MHWLVEAEGSPLLLLRTVTVLPLVLLPPLLPLVVKYRVEEPLPREEKTDNVIGIMNRPFSTSSLHHRLERERAEVPLPSQLYRQHPSAGPPDSEPLLFVALVGEEHGVDSDGLPEQPRPL